MKYLLTILSSITIISSSFSQSNQTKEFYVNAYQILSEESEEKKESLCDGFYIKITTDKINIGDDYDLNILHSDYNAEKNFTFYVVEDFPKDEDYKLCAAILGTDSNGENYLEVHYCDEQGNLIYEGGMYFFYWDYVPYYELWRLFRNRD